MNIAIIGIGSNIDAEKNIQLMLKILEEEVEIIRVSSFKTTKPIGIKNQPDFTNGVVKISTGITQSELKQLLKGIENSLGRDRSEPKFGPRTIDLDIIIWNGEIVDKDYYTREFIRESIKEL
ncbi:MAG: 2-amino-4-hydroxy-6-hydroxymethyldihydropteridine diphosphokinase [Prolixibacteraceae bacterium]|nr:2-amino-4-hydroxy-6-hydroxymethyldihydropteridine diphosphokinase [Prolixibacteraceae bacterium]MBN2773017.1 2-amino-4-hydroxy-6-hydroxymethyldihydropteridine diphosphokinase [Prolixibacteraceae bacterium]